MVRAFAGDSEAIELTGETYCKVADVDHLLDLAVTLGQDFPGFDRDEAAEPGFGSAQLLAKNPDELATSRRRKRPPREERFFRLPYCFGDAIRVRVLDLGNGLAGQRRSHHAFAAPIPVAVNADALEN